MSFLHSNPEHERHVVIWSRPGKPDEVGGCDSKAEALRQFASLDAIRTGCTPHSGRRLRVMSETEYQRTTQAAVAEALLES